MRLTYLFLLIGILTITKNGSAQQLQDEKRVIFLKETSVSLYLPDASSHTRFTPSATDIDSADLFIKEYLVNTLNLDTSVVQLDNYFRQYVGLLRNGEKYIFMNAFCSKPDYFLQNTNYPKGGGKCYFRAIVNLDDKEVFNFGFNAPK